MAESYHYYYFSGCTLTDIYRNRRCPCRAAKTLIEPLSLSRKLTLLDVIQAVHEEAVNDQETLVTMVHLITSGQVRLCNDAIRAMRERLATADAAA
jgi:hypothetical protein